MKPVSADAGAGHSDAAGKARPARRGRKRDSVQPSAVATAGTAPASVHNQPAPAGAVPPGEGPAVRFPAAGPDSPEATVTPLHPSSATLPEPAWKPHPMVAQYQVDLQRMGIDQTRQGLQVLAMAEKLVSSATSASAASTLSRELDRMMTELEQKTPEAQALLDPSAVIRERTLAKLRAAAAEMTG